LSGRFTGLREQQRRRLNKLADGLILGVSMRHLDG
jgi:hypothetical protein